MKVINGGGFIRRIEMAKAAAGVAAWHRLSMALMAGESEWRKESEYLAMAGLKMANRYNGSEIS